MIEYDCLRISVAENEPMLYEMIKQAMNEKVREGWKVHSIVPMSNQPITITATKVNHEATYGNRYESLSYQSTEYRAMLILERETERS